MLPRISSSTPPDSSKDLALYKPCTYLLTYNIGPLGGPVVNDIVKMHFAQGTIVSQVYKVSSIFSPLTTFTATIDLFSLRKLVP